MPNIHDLKEYRKKNIWDITAKWLKITRMKNMYDVDRYSHLAFAISEFFKESEKQINNTERNKDIMKASDYERELKAYLEKVEKQII